MDTDIPVSAKIPGAVAHSLLNKVQKKAYSAYTGQWNRCNNPNASDYQYYGGRGIKVKYSRIEFMKWYVEKLNEYPGTEPTISRTDHDGDYCFENIKVESFTENRSERWKRRGPAIGNKPRRVGLFSKNTHECIATFPSISKAAQELDMDSGHLHRVCSSKNPTGSEKHSWYYRFV